VGSGGSAFAGVLQGAVFVCFSFMSGGASDADDAADDASVLVLDRLGVDHEQEGHTVGNANCLPSGAVRMRVRSRDGQGIAVDDRNAIRQ
jgi:hypothetical protein